jgi:hypothetical protein
VQIARGVLADFISVQQRHPQPFRWKTPIGTGGRAVSGAAGSSPLGVGATTP